MTSIDEARTGTVGAVSRRGTDVERVRARGNRRDLIRLVAPPLLAAGLITSLVHVPHGLTAGNPSDVSSAPPSSQSSPFIGSAP